jgi:peptidoglycan/xylan/chitin deacetylase (PgdA/CDA1 family)
MFMVHGSSFRAHRSSFIVHRSPSRVHPSWLSRTLVGVLLGATLSCCVWASGLDTLAAEAAPLDSASVARTPAAAGLSGHAVVLMFDDGWQSVYDYAYPLLHRHHLTASLALISNVIGGGQVRYYHGSKGYMNRAEIQEIIDSLGVEIVSHSRTHPFLTHLANDAVREELTGSKQALEAMFHRNIRFFVYPYGDEDDRIRQLTAEAGYALARGIRPGVLDFDRRRFNLPANEVRMTTSLEQVEREIAGSRQSIVFFHRILPTPEVYTEWSVPQFAALLDWLDAKDVQVVTLGDLYDAYREKTPLAARRPAWKDRIEWDLLQEVNVDVTRAAERR